MSALLPDAMRMTHAPVEMTIGTDGLFKLNMSGANRWSFDPGNSSLPAMQAGLWVAATQMLAYDGKVNDGAYYATEQYYPYGSWANPDWPYVSLSATWGPLMVTYNAVFRCLARAFFSRGFVEEILTGYGITGLIQWGGTDQYGKPLGGINFELSASGSGARGVMDGIDTGYAMWNPESDMGNMEIWELAFPMIYLGRRITPDSGGYGKYRGGNAFHSIVMVWNSNNVQLGDGGPGKAFNNAGIYGGYPGTPVLRKQVLCQNTNLAEVFQKKLPYPSYEGDPRSYTFARMVKGDLLILDQPTLLPTNVKPYDVYLCHWNGGPGYGDPLERKPELVEQDINNGHTLPETARSVAGIVSYKDDKTGDWKIEAGKTSELRDEIKSNRIRRAIPARQWWNAEREKILRKEIYKPIKDMYQEGMTISPDWAEGYRSFWELPADFSY
jgi:N-methylhydantoinase B/acetone carboxylase alpha subunit